MKQMPIHSLNTLQLLAEKLNHQSLSPAEASELQMLWRMKRQAERRERYARRNASYPIQSKRQIARNIRKFDKDVDRKAFVYA